MTDQKYFGSFTDRRSVADNFLDSGYHDADWQPPDDFPTDEEILMASYGGASYEGDAFVLFQRDGKLYEVHGSHCSCYGLEGQWEPEETTWAALALRGKDLGKSGHFLSDHDGEAVQAFCRLLDRFGAAESGATRS